MTEDVHVCYIIDLRECMYSCLMDVEVRIGSLIYLQECMYNKGYPPVLTCGSPCWFHNLLKECFIINLLERTPGWEPQTC